MTVKLLSPVRIKRFKPTVVDSVIACGQFMPADDYHGNPLDINNLFIEAAEATYMIQAIGDSMIGEGISEGDWLITRRDLDPKDGDIVIAYKDNEFTCKILRQFSDRVELHPANPEYDAIVISGDEELQCFGVVVGVTKVVKRADRNY